MTGALHSLMIVVPPGTDDETCKRSIVEKMLSLYPDAMVKGAPDILRSGPFASVEVTFTSPMYDTVARSLVALLHGELEDMEEELRSATYLTPAQMKEYSALLAAITDRICSIFTPTEKE